MGRMVIVGYRPRPGKEKQLLGIVKEHLLILRTEGLATDRASLAMRAADGTIIEVFEWKSQAAIDAAHENQAVRAMWARFEEACEYVPIAHLAETKQLFAAFEPLEV